MATGLKHPNLIVIGAQKSGTTSLHDTLDKHPDIFMSKPLKEANYYWPEDKLKGHFQRYGYKGIENRKTLLNFMMRGYKGQKYFGESPTTYTQRNNAERFDIPRRISIESPDAKLIYIVRNPFERMLSMERHNLSRYKTSTFEKVLATGDIDGSPLVLNSMYCFQISIYLEHINKENIFILSFEDFIEKGNDKINDIFSFLDLPNVDSLFVSHKNSSKVRGSGSAEKLPKDIIESCYQRIVQDVAQLENRTGFDASRWNLDFDRWCDAFETREID